MNTEHVPSTSEGSVTAKEKHISSQENNGARTGELHWGATVLLGRNSQNPGPCLEMSIFWR